MHDRHQACNLLEQRGHIDLWPPPIGASSIISPFITHPRDMHGASPRPPLNNIISFCQHDRFRLRFVHYLNASFIFWHNCSGWFRLIEVNFLFYPLFLNRPSLQISPSTVGSRLQAASTIMAAERPSKTALLVIDIQEGFKSTSHWGPSRSNPKFESNAFSLITSYRSLIKSSPTSSDLVSQTHPYRPLVTFTRLTFTSNSAWICIPILRNTSGGRISHYKAR